MSKQQLIEAIRDENPTAAEIFLRSFDEPTLRTYLDRLTRLQGHRGKASTWIRQATVAPATAAA